jgi:hypothetical protein
MFEADNLATMTMPPAGGQHDGGYWDEDGSIFGLGGNNNRVPAVRHTWERA